MAGVGELSGHKDKNSDLLIKTAHTMVVKGKVEAIWVEMEDYGIGCLFESGLITLFDKIVRGGDIAYNRGYNQMYDLPLLEIPFPGDVLKVGVPAAKFGEYLLLSYQQQPKST